MRSPPSAHRKGWGWFFWPVRGSWERSCCTVPLAHKSKRAPEPGGPQGCYNRSPASGSKIDSGGDGEAANCRDAPRPGVGVTCGSSDRTAQICAFRIQEAQTVGWASCPPPARKPWSPRRPRLSTGPCRRRWISTATMTKDEGNDRPAPPMDWKLWHSRRSANKGTPHRATTGHRTSRRPRRPRTGLRPGRRDGIAQARRNPRRDRPRRRPRVARRSHRTSLRPRARRSRHQGKPLEAQRRRHRSWPRNSRPRASSHRNTTRTASPRIVRPCPRRSRRKASRSGPPRKVSSRRRCRPRPRRVSALTRPPEERSGAPRAEPGRSRRRAEGQQRNVNLTESAQSPGWSSTCNPRTL